MRRVWLETVMEMMPVRSEGQQSRFNQSWINIVYEALGRYTTIVQGVSRRQ